MDITRLYLTRGSTSIPLDGWLSDSGRLAFQATAGLSGLGLPPVEHQWSEGAGDGASWQGGRLKPRQIDMPVTIRASNRSELQSRLDLLASVLASAPTDSGDPDTRLELDDGTDRWWVAVVRDQGGEWASGRETDSRTFLSTTLTLKAPSPFWTRTEPESFTVQQSTDSKPFLPRLALLQISSSVTFGERTMSNPGTVDAIPNWRIEGPCSQIELTGASDEALIWEGSLQLGEVLDIDCRRQTVTHTDSAGIQTNAFHLLSTMPIPLFWRVPPGESVISVQVQGTTTDTRVTCWWWPRRWLTL